MISPTDINAPDGNSQDGLTVNRTGQAKGNARDTGESFNKVLNESIREIEAKEIHFKKDLFSFDSVSPVFQPAGLQEADGKGNFSGILATVLKHEGSAYVRRDGDKGASKFGILQSTARAYGYKGDVKSMTRADAEAVYRKLWDKSGAASLPYPMSLIHFDTFVNSPAAARRFLNKSGGDAETYLDLRARRYSRLAKMRPARFGRYLGGWMNRIASLKTITSEYMMAKDLRNDKGIIADNPDDKIA